MVGPTTYLPMDGHGYEDRSRPMLIFDNTQMGLERALSGAAARQTAIATNLANVNTPGYRRQDVNFEDALKAAFKSGDSRMLENSEIKTVVDMNAPMRVDGSSADIDSEVAAQAKNGLQYNAVASVIKTRNQIIRSALGIG